MRERLVFVMKDKVVLFKRFRVNELQQGKSERWMVATLELRKGFRHRHKSPGAFFLAAQYNHALKFKREAAWGAARKANESHQDCRHVSGDIGKGNLPAWTANTVYWLPHLSAHIEFT